MVMQQGSRHTGDSVIPAAWVTNPEYWGTQQDLPDLKKEGRLRDERLRIVKVRLKQDQVFYRKALL